LKCKRICLKKEKYHRIINVPSGIIKNRWLIINSFEKIYFLLDYVTEQIKERPLINVLETHLNICGYLFLNDWIVEIFNRYNFEKRYNVSSFGNDIDKIPGWWKQIVNVIDGELNLIEKITFDEKMKKNG
jgi:hypothetical protein